MPHKPSRPCKYPGCVHTTLSAIGYCEAHASFYQPPQRAIDSRPSASARGYGQDWQRIRAEVLQDAGIPRELWADYDVHHTPPYNSAIEPNHRAYTLTPLLHGEHSRETGRTRGRGVKSLQSTAGNRKGYSNFYSAKMEEGGKNGR